MHSLSFLELELGLRGRLGISRAPNLTHDACCIKLAPPASAQPPNMATFHFTSCCWWFVVGLAYLMSHATARGPCDPLVPEYCLLPFPNSFYTKRDPSTKTGIKIDLSNDSIPRYEWGTRVNPRDWNSFGMCIREHIAL